MEIQRRAAGQATKHPERQVLGEEPGNGDAVAWCHHWQGIGEHLLLPYQG